MRSVKSLLLILVLVFSLSSLVLAEYPPEVDAWLREVKLGEYQEDEINYDSLYELAKKEGKLVVYAGTSRMGRVAEAFMEKYPGIEVEPDMMSTAEVIEKYEREVRAGQHRADLVQASQAGRQQELFYKRNYLFPWTPPDLKDELTETQQRPFLHWRYGSRQWAYNNSTTREDPFTSLWELTEPAWKGKVMIGDPRLDGGTLDYFITIVLRADEMAAEYENYFGKSIELSTPNAGYEWIKRLFANDPILVKSEKAIPAIMGEQGLEDPPVGLIAGSRFRYVGTESKGYLKFYPTLNTKPSIGLLSIYTVGITYKAPHPNAAKLFLRFLYGDENGGEGWAPFHEPGNWPARSGKLSPPEHKDAPEVVEALWPVSKLNFWTMDPESVFRYQIDVLDFISEALF